MIKTAVAPRSSVCVIRRRDKVDITVLQGSGHIRREESPQGWLDDEVLVRGCWWAAYAAYLAVVWLLVITLLS